MYPFSFLPLLTSKNWNPSSNSTSSSYSRMSMAVNYLAATSNFTVRHLPEGPLVHMWNLGTSKDSNVIQAIVSGIAMPAATIAPRQIPMIAWMGLHLLYTFGTSIGLSVSKAASLAVIFEAFYASLSFSCYLDSIFEI